MEIEEPIKKNDDASDEQNELESSLEQVNPFDLFESSEGTGLSEESSMPTVKELESNLETPEEIIQEIDQSSFEVSETESEVVDSSLAEPPKKPMPKWLRNGLIILGTAFVLLLAGYLIAYFTSIVPNQNLYQTTVNQLEETKSQLEDLNEKYDQLNNDFTELNEENNSLKADYQSLEQSFGELSTTNELQRNLLSLKYEVANARYYLQKADKISSRQAIILAVDYFEVIKDKLDPDISSGIEDRLETIQKSINTKPDDALDELGTLFENLERIPLD